MKQKQFWIGRKETEQTRKNVNFGGAPDVRCDDCVLRNFSLPDHVAPVYCKFEDPSLSNLIRPQH